MSKGFKANLIVALAVTLSGLTLPAFAHGGCGGGWNQRAQAPWMDWRQQQYSYTQNPYAFNAYAPYGYGYSNGYDPYNGGSLWGQTGNTRPASFLKTLVRNYLLGY